MVKGLQRESLISLRRRLINWMDENLESKNKNHAKQVTTNVIQYANQVTANDDSLSEKTQRRLNYVLDRSIGRTYFDLFWMTLEALG